MIALTVNGKPRELEAETPLLDFLQWLGVDRRLVAVAINGEVGPKNQHGKVTLRHGDQVEVVRMVGGGAAPELGARSSKFDRPSTSKAEPANSKEQLAGRPAAAPASSLEPRTGDTNSASVVIVGAGVIGCAIAYELSRRGVSAVVLDSRRTGMAATNAAAGVLSPLAEFKRPGALVQLGLASLRRYPAWVERLREDAPDIDVEFAINGVLRVAFDDEELAVLREGRRFRDELGMELVELDATMVHEVEPRLSERVVGGVLSTEEGQVSNQLFTLALARAAEKHGARIIEFAPVTGFDRRGDRVTGVRTEKGDFACDRVVLAAGSWTRPIARKLGLDVPTRPMRGQMLAFGRMVTPVQHVVWGERGYLVPRANGIVFAGATVEDVGFRFGTTKRGLESVRRGAFELVPQLRYAREHFSWFGFRPGSPDGLPMLGRLPGWSNAWLATAHFRNGILLAPITGELLAGAIIEDRPSEALVPFDPARCVRSR
jgi:glycine oxidase